MNFKTFFKLFTEAKIKLSKKEKLEKRIESNNGNNIHIFHDSPIISRGYILDDGSLCDIGEYDHRQISFLYYQDDNEDNLGDIMCNLDNCMLDFMSTMGSIRYHKSSDEEIIMSYIKKPTTAQIRTILSSTWDKIYIDKYSPSGYSIKHLSAESYEDYEVDKFLRKN